MNKALGIVALIFIIAGLGAGIVAIATNYWAEHGDDSIGFFQTCHLYSTMKSNGPLCYNNLADENIHMFEDDTWYIVTVACHCGGTFFGFIGMVLWFTSLCSHSTGPRAGAILTLILSFGGILAGVILWKFKYVEDGDVFKINELFKDKEMSEGYTFWIAVGSAGAMGISTILAIVAAIAHRRK